MKIVIDIPEDVYNRCKEYRLQCGEAEVLESAIARGTPTGECIINAIKSVPSVEPERKKGKWIKVVNPDTNEWVGGFKCSECDRCCAQMSINYCANCGAPMEVQNE